MSTVFTAGRLLTTQEAARYLGVAAGTLCNKRSRGEGPAFVRVGRAVRYSEKSLEEFVCRNQIDPGAGGGEAG